MATFKVMQKHDDRLPGYVGYPVIVLCITGRVELSNAVGSREASFEYTVDAGARTMRDWSTAEPVELRLRKEDLSVAWEVEGRGHMVMREAELREGMRMARFHALRRNLRLTQAEIAAVTGYSPGYVSKWAHRGCTMKVPPQKAIESLEEFRLEKARSLQFVWHRDVVENWVQEMSRASFKSRGTEIHA